MASWLLSLRLIYCSAAKGSKNSEKLARGTGKLDAAAKKGQRSLEGIGRSASRAGNEAGKAAGGVSKLKNAIGGLVSAYAAIQAAKFVFFKTAELETQTRSLKVLTGSIEKPRALSESCRSLAT